MAKRVDNNKIIVEILDDIVATERKWLSAGGLPEHFRFLHVQRDRGHEVLARGPVGFGACPELCVVVTQKSWVTDDRQFTAFREALSAPGRALTSFYVDSLLKAAGGVTVPVLDYGLYASLWVFDAFHRKAHHDWWSDERTRWDSRWFPLIKYRHCRGIGMPAMPLFDAMITAYENGDLPVGLDGERPIVLKLSEAQVAKDGARAVAKLTKP